MVRTKNLCFRLFSRIPFPMKSYGQKPNKSLMSGHPADCCSICSTDEWKQSKNAARFAAKEAIAKETLDLEDNITRIEIMKLNVKTPRKPLVFTHEGAVAKNITPAQELRRSVMACMLWENSFYESGKDIADRIAELVAQVSGVEAMNIAIEAREQMKLRHTPLYIVRLMAKNPHQRSCVAETLTRVIQRADELSEFLSLYWKDGRQPISKQVKKGLAQAFTKFDEYSLAKYNKDGAVKLRDVLFLVHARPNSPTQAALWKRLVNDELNTPDTWEVELSASTDKRGSWTRLLEQKKLGAMALVRNLRNMTESKVDDCLIRSALINTKTDRVLPFRFIAAARFAPKYIPELEIAMFKCLENHERLAGKTIILIDVSISMQSKVSGRSEISRLDAAKGLAMLIREVSTNSEVYTFNYITERVANKRGFALADAIGRARGGTKLGEAVKDMNTKSADRIIVITDEQSADRVPDPAFANSYMINVAACKNGVGYGKWTHMDGWSDSIVSYIISLENEG